jgi:CAAX protease family protein
MLGQARPDFTVLLGRAMIGIMRERWSRTGRSEAALRVATGYALLATVATALALALRDGLPWIYPEPWFPSPAPVGLVVSSVLGLFLATVLIAATRVTVPRYEWARRLHVELRPVARDLTAWQILLVAGLSSLGEELLFRGLLTPTIGVLASALLFGLAHQMKGPSRWVWVGWATVVGAGLGAIFAATGSLVGPLLAHAIVNAVNLTYLRDHDPDADDPERNPA